MAAPVALRNFGPVDNAAYYQAWLKSDPLFDKLFMSRISFEPFLGNMTDGMLPTMNYLAWCGRYFVVHPNKILNRMNVMVSSWADLMGPQIAMDKFPTENEARKMCVEAVQQLIDDNRVSTLGSATAASYAEKYPEAPANEWATFKAAEPHENAIEVAIKILRHLAGSASGVFAVGGVGIIIHIYLATLKRGMISEQFITKITSGLLADLQISNMNVDAAACELFYSVFGQYVDETNISVITQRWLGLLPITALRLRLTVTQAAGGGLTALSVTGRAIRIFSDFDWGRIRQLYFDEWTNFEQAVALVGNNEWYGFRKELGIVSSTKYKNLSYVAKELLLKVNGEASLRSYAGWTRRARFQGVVDTLVATYETDKTKNILDGTAMPAIREDADVVALRTNILAGGNVYA
ncbi:putative coat protein [Lampyris noctiluca chuvirus-like virus 1]|uniref:Coat protein n=1 Tax=Lampyris noctiluca chuvirus-like virus 1 TaxID=2553070 RepID=A0A482JSJ9_9VIRU|nr:putative coat protein [Lampyris noctiluca chuvirus-like virus 1]